MPASVLEYWNGSAWVAEPNLIRFTLTDRLQEPMELDALISNFSDTALNTKESNYGKFMKVRLKERFSNKYIFYGKILRTTPSRDSHYGHSVNILALDNLRELATKTVDDDITGQTTRSGLISTILSNDTWPSNITVNDTTKFKTSTATESSGVLNKTFTGDRKKLLDIIQSIASSDINGSIFGYDFYLDTEFNGNTPTPDFFYYPRGTIPSGTMPASGLTLEYSGTESDQVMPIAGDYSFPRQSSELKTRAKVRWVDEEDKPRKTDCILIHHGATSGGNFDQDDIITWSGGGSARVVLLANNNRWLIIGPDAVDVDDKESNSNWLNSISGLSISSGGVSATVNSTTSTPPGSLRESIESEAEVILQSYDTSSERDAAIYAAGVLYSAGDTVIRGQIHTYSFPQYTIKGTHTGSSGASSLTDSSKTFTNLGIFNGDIIKNTADNSQATITTVAATNIAGTLSSGTDNDWDSGDTYEIPITIRAGHIVYVKGIPSGSSISNQSVLVTEIEYNEGPGLQVTVIKVAVHSDGRTSIPISPQRSTQAKITVAADVPSNNQAGVKPRSTINWTTSIPFTPDGTNGHNTVDWASGTIFFFDGTNFAISAGTTGAMVSPTFIYFSKSSPTVLQFTTSASIAQGSNNIVLATCEDVASGGTVTIETTTGVAHKNYYSMDALFDGAAYGRIAVGNLLSNNLNLGSGSLAGVLTLDKTADSTSGSGRKAVTTNEKTGADRGYNGFDTNSFLSKNHFLSDIGLAFQTSDTNTWAGMNGNGIIGINNNVLQFQISATNGAAGFGGNTGSEASPTYPCTLNSAGLTITNGAKIHIQTAGVDSARITIDSDGIYGYASDNTAEFYITAGTGKAYFANGKVVADCGGLTLTSTGNTAQIKFYNEDSTPVYLSGVYSLGDTTIWAAADGKSLLIGDNNLGANHDTEVIKLASQYIEFSNVNQDYTTPYKYVFPIYDATDYGNLTGKFLKATKGSSRVVHLSWEDSTAVSYPLLAPDGSNAAPSYSFSSDTDTGLRYYLSGSYRGITFVANGRDIFNVSSNGSSIDVLSMDSTLDMNSFDIIDVDDIQCDDITCTNITVSNDVTVTDDITCDSLNVDDVFASTGAYGTPSHSFTGYSNSGMYYSGGVYIAVGGTTKFGCSAIVNYNYQQVLVSDYPDIDSAVGFYLKSDSTGLIKESTSTMRAKMDIQDITIDTSKVYNLQAKSFRYRMQQVTENGASIKDENGLKLYTDVPAQGADSPLQIGMIAEEVYEHIPEIVSINRKANQPIGIDYPLLSVLLLEEMKKLQARIEVLEGN